MVCSRSLALTIGYFWMHGYFFGVRWWPSPPSCPPWVYVGLVTGFLLKHPVASALEVGRLVNDLGTVPLQSMKVIIAQWW